MLKIALDAMGGDHAPEEVVQGAVLAARQYSCHIVLVGDEQKIRQELQKYDAQHLNFSVVHASQTIAMEESPSKASRDKKDSSLVVAINLLAQNQVEAVVSAGNSGAVMTSALRYLGRLPGIYRPAIATVIPTLSGHCIVSDVGANSDCKPEYLLQFAIMAKIAAQNILNIKNPKIGLLSIGEEKEKGNHLTKHTTPLLETHPDINFIGNVEGRDIPQGTADVIVCDGFVGNVVLKTMEGTAGVIGKMVKGEIMKSLLAKIGYLFLHFAMKNLRKKLDYAEYGGAPLLGVNGTCIISHGKSNAKAIKNAIGVAIQFVEHKVNLRIQEQVARTPKTEE